MKCVILLSAFIISGCAKTLPSFIKKCKREDSVSELSKCIAERAVFLKPYLEKGIPEMKLPSIDPLHIPKFQMHLPSTSTFGFNANLTNIKAYGGKDFDIKELQFDLANKRFLLHFTFPLLYVDMSYNFKGKILLFELDSSGKGYGNISDIESKSFVQLSFKTKNGKEYINIQVEPSSYIKHGHAHVYFENLFPNNGELTKATNKAINENAEAVAAEVDPLIFQACQLLVAGIIKTVLGDYSVDELFD